MHERTSKNINVMSFVELLLKKTEVETVLAADDDDDFSVCGKMTVRVWNISRTTE